MTESAAWATLCVFAALISVLAAWHARRSLRLALKLHEADERIMRTQERYQASMQVLTEQLVLMRQEIEDRHDDTPRAPH